MPLSPGTTIGCYAVTAKISEGGWCFPGIVKLLTRASFFPWAVSTRAPLAGAGQLIPETERAGSQETMVSCPEQVTTDPEQILDNAVHRCEPLQMGG